MAAAPSAARHGRAWLACAVAAVTVSALATGFEPIVLPVYANEQIAALAGDGRSPPSLLRLSYDNIEFTPTVAQLLYQLRHQNIPACVEDPLEDAVPMPRCPDGTAVGTGQTTRWQLVRRQLCADHCSLVSTRWGLRPLPSVGAAHQALEIDFGSEEAGRYLGRGWSKQEPWGRWTDGPDAEILIPATSLPAGDLRIQFDIFGFVTAALPRLVLPVTVNGHLLDFWTFREDLNRGRRSLWIPADIVAARPTLSIAFSQIGKISPSMAGLSRDTRMLGVAVAQITVFSFQE